MGKIRVKTLGIDEVEKQEKKEVKQRKEQKKLVKVPGLKGGERVTSVGVTEDELTKFENEPKTKTDQAKVSKTTAKKTPVTKRVRSKQYQLIAQIVDKNKIYALKEALDLLPKLKRANFDETVELHINTIETGLSGDIMLPHGNGKKTRIAIADDELIEKVAKGKIDFDVLVSTAQMMPKLAKIAKILGPKGLMPNPKNGTISENPEEVVKKFESGKIRFKTESKTPIIHLAVGKVSFGEKKLAENIKAVFSTIQSNKIKKVVIKSTMSPGIKLESSLKPSS